jgi:hypothetical protein
MYVEGVGHKIHLLYRELQWSIVLSLLINHLLILYLEDYFNIHVQWRYILVKPYQNP